jgi:hypothetical protein
MKLSVTIIVLLILQASAFSNMSGSPGQINDALIRDASDGILKKEASSFQNWMKTTTTTPAKLVKVNTIEQIQTLVPSDVNVYPSPICPTGSILSHTDIHSNNGGTTLLMSGMNNIHGILTHTYTQKDEDGTRETKEAICLETEPCASTL